MTIAVERSVGSETAALISVQASPAIMTEVGIPAIDRGQKEAPLFLSLVPGGAAMDAAMAVRLDAALEAAAGREGAPPPQGGDSPAVEKNRAEVVASQGGFCRGGQGADRQSLLLLQRLLERHRPSVLLPALRVLRAIAGAVPVVLAVSSGSSTPEESSSGAGKQRRVALNLVRR